MGWGLGSYVSDFVLCLALFRERAWDSHKPVQKGLYGCRNLGGCGFRSSGPLGFRLFRCCLEVQGLWVLWVLGLGFRSMGLGIRVFLDPPK